jgi:hypothetical protein
MERTMTETWIQTRTGRRFELGSPQSSDIILDDIAFPLFKIPRYTGHLPLHYTVGHHSLAVAERVRFLTNNDPLLVMTAFLHDASEAYTGDLSTPLKNLVPEFRTVEDKLNLAISAAFGTIYPFPDVIKQADAELTSTEAEYFLVRGALDNWNRKLAAPLSPVAVYFVMGFDAAHFIQGVFSCLTEYKQQNPEPTTLLANIKSTMH